MARILLTVLLSAWVLFVDARRNINNLQNDADLSQESESNNQRISAQRIHNRKARSNCDFGGCSCPEGGCSFNFQGDCPPTICAKGCSVVMVPTSKCPICDCKAGKSCRTNNDCGPSGATCRAGLCRRRGAVSYSFRSFCAFAHQCQETEDCDGGVCEPVKNGKRHVTGRSCVFNYECPSGYECDEMTCWKSQDNPTKRHIEGRRCVFASQCPPLYECDEMTCVYTGKYEYD